jgi:hypothetical protein
MILKSFWIFIKLNLPVLDVLVPYSNLSMQLTFQVSIFFSFFKFYTKLNHYPLRITKEFIHNVLKTEINENFQQPTALQCICWPILLSKRDLLAVSNSGYGKHLAVSYFIFFFQSSINYLNIN